MAVAFNLRPALSTRRAAALVDPRGDRALRGRRRGADHAARPLPRPRLRADAADPAPARRRPRRAPGISWSRRASPCAVSAASRRCSPARRSPPSASGSPTCCSRPWSSATSPAGRGDDRALHHDALPRRRRRRGPRGAARAGARPRMAGGARRLGGARIVAAFAWAPFAAPCRSGRRRRLGRASLCAIRWPGRSPPSWACNRRWPTCCSAGCRRSCRGAGSRRSMPGSSPRW